MSVVADSLTALIEQLYEQLHEHRGQHWYWLQPGFERLGDAYDATYLLAGAGEPAGWTRGVDRDRVDDT
jgi:hypothetical protein